ncbi:TorF family putative porin [Oxalobacteraceae bacterium A2-2]
MSATRIFLQVLALAAASGAALAADPAPDWTSSGNLSLVSDYLFRGVSQTQAKPTAQATLDFTHSSGWYVGLFGSGVSHAAYNNGGGAEIDLYGGYRATLSDTSNLDAGLVTYWYPGAHYAAGGKDIKYHTQDAKLAWNSGAFNVTGWVTLSKYWFGFTVDPYSGKQVDTRGTLYGEVNWNPELAPGLVLNLHAGRQQVRKLGMYNFYDVKAGLTKTVGSFAFSAAAVYNSGDEARNGTPLWVFYNADGSGKYVAQKRLLLTASRNF